LAEQLWRFDLAMALDTIKTKWSTLKPNVRKRWGRITEDDLSQVTGTKAELINILRKRYGYGKEQAEIEINNWLLQQHEHQLGV
jgi:uncharacterized protein YjbJ (UPF0337 family)